MMTISSIRLLSVSTRSNCVPRRKCVIVAFPKIGSKQLCFRMKQELKTSEAHRVSETEMCMSPQYVFCACTTMFFFFWILSFSLVVFIDVFGLYWGDATWEVHVIFVLNDICWSTVEKREVVHHLGTMLKAIYKFHYRSCLLIFLE